jgi:hypothetical protein
VPKQVREDFLASPAGQARGRSAAEPEVESEVESADARQR